MRLHCGVIVAGVLMFALTVRAAIGEEAPAAPDFNADVAPILTKYCAGCHGTDEPESGLNLETHVGLLAGGDQGPAIVAGNSDESLLIGVLTGKAEPAMPPEGSEGPNDDEIAVLRAWIDAGAPRPSGAGSDRPMLVTPAIEPRVAPRRPIHAAAFARGGKKLALAGYRQVSLVSVETRAVERVFAELHGAVNDVRFSSDGRLLVTASGEPGLFGEATLWNVADGSQVATFGQHKDSLYAAALSPDGRRLATAGYDKQIILWDVESGSPLHVLTAHNGCVYDLAFRPDGNVLASASADRTVKLWDPASGERLDTLGQSLKELYAVAFSPDGAWLVAGGVDNRIRAWQISADAREGTSPLVHARFAHQGAILKLAYSPDGKTLVSTAEDGTVKLWETETLTERLLLPSQSDWPTAADFAPDGRSLVIGRLDGSFTVYDAESGEIVRPPAPELAAIQPRAVQRGIATRLKLTGASLLAATSIELNHPGLSATIVPAEPGKAGDGSELWIDLVANTNVPPGRYELAASGEGGTSAKRPFYVDSLAQVQETEPNNLASEANTVEQPVGIWGTIAAAGDVDMFRFAAQAGQRLVCELAAKTLSSKLGGVLTLYDATGRVLQSSNGFDGDDDPLLHLTVPADGMYTLAVGSLLLDGSDEHFYRLTIGEFPYVTGVYPLSVPADERSEIELAGFNLPDDARVWVNAEKGGEITVPIDAEAFRSRRALRVAVGQLPEVRESEPNDSPSEATEMTVPGVAVGRIHNSDGDEPDVDLFAFETAEGEQWILEIDAARRGSPVDTRIEVLDAEGQPVERLLLQATRDSWVEFRGFDSNGGDPRVANWEEMELNEYIFFQGEVNKIFRQRRGPDSGFLMYNNGGKRIAYFDTTATAHALEEPCYIVEPHPPGTELVPSGLPVFTLYYANDDDGERKLGRDSRLTFTAPASGRYLVRVSDVRGMQGDRFAYRLIVRRPAPDFRVSVRGQNPAVRRGGGRSLTLVADRIDGFEGPIRVEIDGLPPGFRIASPIVIQPGHFEAQTVLYADDDAPAPSGDQASASRVTATAEIGGSPVLHDAGSLGKISLDKSEKVLVRMEPAEITVAPGKTVRATLKVIRQDFNESVSFEVQNLPHGVIVDNIGLNGVLIPAGQSEREIFLSARPWVPETTRDAHAVATTAGNEASPPVVFHVRRPDVVARADGGE